MNTPENTDEEYNIESLINAAEAIISENREKNPIQSLFEDIFASNSNYDGDFLADLQEISESENNLFVNESTFSHQNVPTPFPQIQPDVEIIDITSPSPIRSRKRRRRNINYCDEIIDLDDSPSPPKRTSTVPYASSSLQKTPEKSASSNKSQKGITCPICMESAFGKKPVSTICGHVFCHGCLNSALRLAKSCPVCRKKILKKDFHPIFV